MKLNIFNDEDALYEELKIDCKKCFGLCCMALYFSKLDGFPQDKEAGKPCCNLAADFTCQIHKDLAKKGLKGCMAYDCLGAGQKLSQVTYKRQAWKRQPEQMQEFAQTFLVMYQFHEMMWYLIQARTVSVAQPIKSKIVACLEETKRLTHLSAQEIVDFEIEVHRDKVNTILKQVVALVQEEVKPLREEALKQKKVLTAGASLLGHNLTKTNLIGEDLGGTLLIMANLKGADLTGTNLIGVDMRNANLEDADLSNALFLTQAQINTARGNARTRLPKPLIKPQYWL